MMKEFTIRRKLIVDGLRSLKGVECSLPGGSFFVFPNVKGTGMNGEKFTEKCLLEAGVAMVPGTAFGKFATPASNKHFSVNFSPFIPVPLTLGNTKKDPPGKLHSTPFKLLNPSTISFLLIVNSFIISFR
jgi:hypothetical protein